MESWKPRAMNARNVTERHLLQWDRVPFEHWPVKLKAVSANADGIVNSGILSDGRYFFRKWLPGFRGSKLIFEGR